MIKPICDKCKKELLEFGALILSPPQGNQVTKFHICYNCWTDLNMNWLLK